MRYYSNPADTIISVLPSIFSISGGYGGNVKYSNGIVKILPTGCGTVFTGTAGKYAFGEFFNVIICAEETLELAKYTKCSDKTVVIVFSIW